MRFQEFVAVCLYASFIDANLNPKCVHKYNENLECRQWRRTSRNDGDDDDVNLLLFGSQNERMIHLIIFIFAFFLVYSDWRILRLICVRTHSDDSVRLVVAAVDDDDTVHSERSKEKCRSFKSETLVTHSHVRKLKWKSKMFSIAKVNAKNSERKKENEWHSVFFVLICFLNVLSKRENVRAWLIPLVCIRNDWALGVGRTANWKSIKECRQKESFKRRSELVITLSRVNMGGQRMFSSLFDSDRPTIPNRHKRHSNNIDEQIERETSAERITRHRSDGKWTKTKRKKRELLIRWDCIRLTCSTFRAVFRDQFETLAIATKLNAIEMSVR